MVLRSGLANLAQFQTPKAWQYYDVFANPWQEALRLGSAISKKILSLSTGQFLVFFELDLTATIATMLGSFGLEVYFKDVVSRVPTS